MSFSTSADRRTILKLLVPGGGLVQLSAPSAPTNLTASPVNSIAIDTSWSDVPGATSYTIDRSLNGTSWTQLVVLSGATFASTYRNTGLTANTIYFYRVKATNAASQDSGWSNTFSTRTLQGNAVPPAITNIAAAIKSGLQSITTANGYYNNVRRVYDPPINPGDMKEFPAINLFFGDVVNENIGGGRGAEGDGNQAKLHMNFTMEMDCWLREANTPREAQEKMASDIAKYFGNYYWIPDANGVRTVFNCQIEGWTPFGTENMEADTGVTVRLKVWWRQLLTDPTQLT